MIQKSLSLNYGHVWQILTEEGVSMDDMSPMGKLDEDAASNATDTTVETVASVGKADKE